MSRSSCPPPVAGPDVTAPSPVAIVHEHDYPRRFQGIVIDALQTGESPDGNRVSAYQDERLTAASCEIGFPMLSWSTVADDSVALAVIEQAPAGSRWCEMDLVPGALVAYGPGAEHTAMHTPGLRFVFVVADLALLAERSDRLERRIDWPPRHEVHQITVPGPSGGEAAEALSALARWPTATPAPMWVVDELVSSLTLAMIERDREREVRLPGYIDSRRVVRRCIDYAESIDRVPSLSELCLAATVSERRLRSAFTDEFGLPPTRFFRTWALERAHTRLRAADPSGETVTSIATTLGFGHLGRFASYYQQRYGQSPSTTLARPIGMRSGASATAARQRSS